MLTNIKMKNIYSIGNLEMNFLKGKFTYKKDMIYKDIVNPASVYGGNGSGKSSFINGMNDLLNLLIGDKDVFYPFIANFNNKKDDSTIELTLKLDKHDYTYSIKTSFLSSKIVNEFLLKDGTVIFTRNEERVIFKDREYPINNPLLLSLRELYSLSDELKEVNEEIKVVYVFLTNLAIVKDNVNCNSKLFNYKNMDELMVKYNDEIKQVISSWKDFPIYDFKKEDDSYYLDIYLEQIDKFKIPGFLISEGMLAISKILTILINLDRNSVLIIDGIEKNLHPFTVTKLIKEAQKREIQLIFTSHSTTLMQDLRPDQIYFAKWNKGYSSYFRLSSIYENIRKINNIEKMYLSNTFDEVMNEIVSIE